MSDQGALPDGKRISFEEASKNIGDYLEENAAAVALYDQTNPGAHDDVTPMDLLSLGALNAFGGSGAMTVLAEAWPRRKQIAEVIRPITTEDFEGLSPERLKSEQALVCNALEWFYAKKVKHWCGSTRPAKLLYRLRPNIVPIWDGLIGQWYGGPKQSWQEYLRAVHKHVANHETLKCLRAINVEHRCNLPVLRLWDMLLWKRANSAPHGR